MTQLRWQMHVGFAVESSGWGVAAPTPAQWVPVHKCTFKDDLKYYYDSAYRSVQAAEFGAYPTTGEADFDLSCDVYVDTMPVLLGVGMIGDNDAVRVVNSSLLNVSYTTGTCNEHAFILQPNGPRSLTLFDYNGFNERAYSGARINDVSLKYTHDGALTADIKGKTRLSTLQASTTIPVIGQFAPILGWQAALTLNNTASARLLDASFDFKRAIEVLYTQVQTQAPTNIYAMPMMVDASLTVDFQDDYEYNLYRTGNMSATFDIFFVSSSNNAVRFTIANPVYTAYEVDRSKDALTAKIKMKGMYNANTSTNVKVLFYNSQVAAY